MTAPASHHPPAIQGGVHDPVALLHGVEDGGVWTDNTAGRLGL